MTTRASAAEAATGDGGAAGAAGAAAPPADGGARCVRAHLRALAPYTPIVPFDVLSARLGRDPADIIKLDANENP
jgi:histidinol-phosphate aminotransferase